MNTAFTNIIGQDHIKRELSFYLTSAKAGGAMPPLLLAGGAGMGKTMFARTLGAPSALARPVLEINASTIKGPSQFFEQIVMPWQDKPCVIFLDEADKLPPKVVACLLSILNTEGGNVKEFTFDDYTFSFDFRLVTFLFATTETDKLFRPLKDRLTLVDFREYTPDETAALIKARCKGKVRFTGDALAQVASTARCNPRFAVQRAKVVMQWQEQNAGRDFTPTAWSELSHQVGIQKGGLSSSEIMLLKCLAERGACSLTMLAAATRLSKQAVQRDIECNLLADGYIRIEGNRRITSKGLEALKAVRY